jgi:hypothetical protein
MGSLMDAHVVITREQAIAQGLARYFTGTPCNHGHVAERYVKGYMCIPCNLAIVRRSSARKRERKRQTPEFEMQRRERAAADHAARVAHKAQREDAQRRKARLPVIARVCQAIARRREAERAQLAAAEARTVREAEYVDVDWSDLPPYVPSEPLSDYWFEFIFGYKREDAAKVLADRASARDKWRRENARKRA